MNVSFYDLTSELHDQIHSRIQAAKSNSPMAAVVLVVDAPLHGLLLRRQLVDSATRLSLANIQVETLDSVIRDLNSQLGLPEIILPTDSALDAASYAAMLANQTLASSGSEALTTAVAISNVYKSLRYNTDAELNKLIASNISDTQKSVIESVLAVRSLLSEKLGIENFPEALQNLLSTISDISFKPKHTYLVLTSTLPKLAEEIFNQLESATRFLVTETDEKISGVEKYVTTPDPRTEAQFVATQVVEYAKSGVHPFDVAVVYSDLQQYGRVLASAFNEAQIPWHGAVETIQQTSNLYRGFDLILQMLEKRNPTSSGAERPLLMRLLESGDFFVDDSKLNAGLCRNLVRDKELYGDSINWLKVLKKVVDPTNKREQKAAEELRALLRTLGKTLDRLESASNWTEFGNELFAVIERFYLGVNEENLSEDEKKIAQKFRQVLLHELPELDALTPADKPGLEPTATAARSFLQRKIGDGLVRHGALTTGVHISDLGEVRLLNFKKVILVGATEGFLPKPNNESVFLTDQMLEEIGELGRGAIATSAKSKTLGSALNSFLGDKMPVVTRSRAAMIGKLDNVPSRYLNVDELKSKTLELRSYNQLLIDSAFGTIVSEAAIELVQNAQSTEGPSPRNASIVEALQVFRNPGESQYFGFIENFNDELSISKRFLSASSIESFMDCEYKFFVTKILGIYTAEREDELKVWRAKDFGNLIHNSMEEFLNDLAADNQLPNGNSPFTSEQIELYFSKYLTDGLEEFYAKGHDAWRAGFESLMNRVERNLRDFFSTEFEKIRSAHKLGVFASELPFGNESDESDQVRVSVLGRPEVKLAGRIDRVDLSADGLAAGVLDFKSGKYSTTIGGDFGKRKLSGPNRGLPVRTKVQDLVYLLAVRKKYPKVEDVIVNFAYIATGTQANFFRAEWMEDAEGQLGEIIERIYSDQDSGLFPVSHKEAIGENTYCDVCQRLGWVAEQLRKEYLKDSGLVVEDGSDD